MQNERLQQGDMLQQASTAAAEVMHPAQDTASVLTAQSADGQNPPEARQAHDDGLQALLRHSSSGLFDGSDDDSGGSQGSLHDL